MKDMLILIHALYHWLRLGWYNLVLSNTPVMDSEVSVVLAKAVHSQDVVESFLNGG